MQKFLRIKQFSHQRRGEILYLIGVLHSHLQKKLSKTPPISWILNFLGVPFKRNSMILINGSYFWDGTWWTWLVKSSIWRISILHLPKIAAFPVMKLCLQTVFRYKVCASITFSISPLDRLLTNFWYSTSITLPQAKPIVKEF